MKRKSLLLLALMLSTGCLISAEEFTGWANTRWGMAQQAVKELYPASAAFDDGSFHGLQFSGFEIEKKSFTVKFFFDSTGGLNQVTLVYDQPPEKHQNEKHVDAGVMVGTLRDRLVEKYGAVDSEERGIVNSTKWNRSGLLINLVHITNVDDVYVIYSEPHKEALRKL